MYVYLMTNQRNTVLYVGVTNDLVRRVAEHRAGKAGSFTTRYRVTKLVCYETFGDPYRAIAREKQLKSGSRQQKLDLIHAANPSWQDLYPSLLPDAEPPALAADPQPATQ